jgi:hypothetical protein
MAESTKGTTPRLVQPRSRDRVLETIRNPSGGFDIDVMHAMELRDNTLIEQELLHGAMSSAFVYDFKIQGTQVAGISVVGARHLAAHYGGLKHRLVASVQKTADLFVFTSYPADGNPMQVTCAVLLELADQPDFYSAVTEVMDIKTGNSVQIERRENRHERRRDGTEYERPHYATIAQSKAYRNAILSIVPQDVLIRWQGLMIGTGKAVDITEDALGEKRANVLRFAAMKGVPVDRHAIEALTIDQITGLGDAAREGSLPAFIASARSLGLEALAEVQGTGESRSLATSESGAGSVSPGSDAPQRDASTAKPAGEPEQSKADQPSSVSSAKRPDDGKLF